VGRRRKIEGFENKQSRVRHTRTSPHVLLSSYKILGLCRLSVQHVLCVYYERMLIRFAPSYRSDRDCRFDQKEESSMIERGLFNIPCRICRRPRTRTRHPERKSKSEGHCGPYRSGRERRNSQIPTSTQALLPTSIHSNGFCIIRVCISSSSSSSSVDWNLGVDPGVWSNTQTTERH
jgi:hypothetical protein